MKNMIWLVIVLMLMGCGGGGSSSGGGSSNGIPMIGASFDQVEVKRGSVVSGTMTWSDSDADITTIYFEEWFGLQRWDLNYPASHFGIKGTNGSTIFWATTKVNASPGIHTIKVYARDAKGQQSNIIEVNMHINAMEQTMDQDIKTPLLSGVGK
jgi:hypothetical protein